jgi:hypothetical protein
MTMLKRIIALVLICTMQLYAAPTFAAESSGIVVSQSFTTTTNEIINPERSWYSWIGGQYCHQASSGSIAAARSAGYSQVLCILDLSGYRTNGTLGSDVTTALTSAASLARAGGVKLVLRPAYNYDNAGCDASLAITLGHVAQLKQTLRDNADVIAYAQAGMFGPYGEFWQGTCSVARTDADRAALKDALLAAYHPRTTISFRYPTHINAMFPAGMQASQFTTGSSQARASGYYQDCLWSDPGEGGTYTSLTDSKRTRVASDTNWLPFGGETCDGSAPRMDCPTVLSDGARYHMTYLNRSYSTTFINSWISGGCYAQIMRSMGYRFQLDSVSHQSTATAGQTITVNVQMRNVGWSRVFSSRRMQVKLMNGGTVAASAMSYLDLRLLPPQATGSQKVPVKVTTPAAGTYTVSLCMPDLWVSTTADPRYAIRPANADSPGAWNATTACFATGTRVIVS